MRKIINAASAGHWPRVPKALMVVLCIGMALVLGNCDQNFFESTSDDDSYEARLEKGIMALDDENYAKAIGIFEKLRSDYPGKTEVCEYLSGAYAGFIGVDSLSFLEIIDEMEEDDAGSIEIAGLLLGDSVAVLTQSDITTIRDYLKKAFDTFEDCIPVRDDDQAVQLGVMAFFDAAMVVAQVVLDDISADWIKLTEEDLGLLYAAKPDFSDVLAIEDYMADLNRDLEYLSDAVAVLVDLSGEDDNDFQDAFEDFLSDLGYDEVSGITYQDLENYIEGL
jgi:hypothetical protein